MEFQINFLNFFNARYHQETCIIFLLTKNHIFTAYSI
jgi:hypothetical protein